MVIKLSLPDGKQPLIKEGDTVDFDTPLIKVIEKKEKKISLAQELDIPAKDIFLSLTKNVGEKIEKDEVLAVKKTLLSKKTYISEFSGIVKEIDHQDGTITLTVSENEGEKINSFFKGKVKKISEKEIELEVQEAVKFELKSATNFFGGEVIFVTDDSLDKIKDDISNKIVIIKKIDEYNQLKLEVIGVAGFVSIEPLSQELDIPSAQLLNKDDWSKLIKLKLPYISVSIKDKALYLYR
jgi:hypothetical protein